MAYIEQADLLTRMTSEELVQTTNDAGGAAVDTDVLDGVLDEVDALVDSHVGVRYGVPVENPSRFLKNLCVSIAVFKLMNRRGMAPEHVERNYDDALKTLDRIATGRIRYDDTAERQPHSARVTGTRTTSTPRTFNDDDMEGF